MGQDRTAAHTSTSPTGSDHWQPHNAEAAPRTSPASRLRSRTLRISDISCTTTSRAIRRDETPAPLGGTRIQRQHPTRTRRRPIDDDRRTRQRDLAGRGNRRLLGPARKPLSRSVTALAPRTLAYASPADGSAAVSSRVAEPTSSRRHAGLSPVSPNLSAAIIARELQPCKTHGGASVTQAAPRVPSCVVDSSQVVGSPRRRRVRFRSRRSFPGALRSVRGWPDGPPVRRRPHAWIRAWCRMKAPFR